MHTKKRLNFMICLPPPDGFARSLNQLEVPGQELASCLAHLLEFHLVSALAGLLQGEQLLRSLNSVPTCRSKSAFMFLVTKGYSLPAQPGLTLIPLLQTCREHRVEA